MHTDKIESEECLIGDKPFCSIFLQTKCGYEEDVIKELNYKISRIKIDGSTLNSKNIKILKCFGHFDIAIIFNEERLVSLTSFEKINQEIIQINYITDSNSILGFSWDCKSMETFEDLSSCWGISSIKLDLNNIMSKSKDPIKIEKDLICKIIEISKKNNVKLKIFGGLGWNEIIAVINSNSLEKISKFVYEIRIFEELLDISTLPAVNWGCWNVETLEQIPNCLLLITHHSRRDFPIRNELILAARRFKINIEKNSKGEDLGLIFGGFDIIVPIINSNLNDIIKYIMFVRTMNVIAKTNTVISPIQIPIESDLPLIETVEASKYNNRNITHFINGSSIQGNENIEIKLYKDEINLIDALENEIRYLRCQYSELNNDSYTCSLYSNLGEFFKEIDAKIDKANIWDIDINETKNYKEKRDQIILLEQLKKIVQCLEFSIYQRISGMQMSYLMEPKHIGFEKFGGIQRIILAIEAIPGEIIPRLSNSNWIGFCVFGSEPDFIAHAIGEVLSIPFEYKYTPHKWWGIGHEIGHLLINKMRKSVLDQFEKDIREDFEVDIRNFKSNIKTLNELYDKKLYEEYVERELVLITELMEEICADYLNFRIIFASDWKAFYTCTLEYLYNRGYDILGEDRLFRIISIGEYINKKDIEKDVDLFKTYEGLCNFDKDASIIFKDRLGIIKNKTYKPYIKTVSKILNELDEELGEINIKKEILKEIDIKLNRGEIIDNNIDLLSIYILKALINKNFNADISFKYQVAAILSLYNSRFSTFLGTSII